MSRLKKRYLEEVKAELQKKFNYANPMMIPCVGENRHQYGNC